MTRPVAVYLAEDDNGNEYMIALSRDGHTYERHFKRHTRFGKKWSGWELTTFERVVAHGHENFKRIDKDVKVVLPKIKKELHAFSN